MRQRDISRLERRGEEFWTELESLGDVVRERSGAGFEEGRRFAISRAGDGERRRNGGRGGHDAARYDTAERVELERHSFSISRERPSCENVYRRSQSALLLARQQNNSLDAMHD